ncbi:hypothetical protein V6N13_085617 [Hibiscus sabdariffa]
MLQLATILHSKGFSITIVHSELNSHDLSGHSEFAFVSIPNNLTRPQLLDGDLASFALCLNKNCAAPLRQCLEQIVHSNSRITAVLYDLLLFCAQIITDDLRLPEINLHTNSATTLLFFSQLDEKDFIFENDSLELQALRLPRLRALISRHPTETMAEMRIWLTNIMKSSSAIILNSMAFLEEEVILKVKEYFPTSIFAIGPLHKLAQTICISILTEDDKCIAWLDKQAPESVIYVSFGSMANIDEHELIEMAWGLVDSGQPFLWIVRPGMVRGSEWKETLPNGFDESVGERGRIVKWTPQKEALAHRAVGGFWSHCGWNLTIDREYLRRGADAV